LDQSAHGLNVGGAGLERRNGHSNVPIGREIESRAVETDIARTSTSAFASMISASNELEWAGRFVKESVAVAMRAIGRLTGSNAALRRRFGGFAGGDGRQFRTDAPVKDRTRRKNSRSG
jgi:hypothetical protein